MKTFDRRPSFEILLIMKVTNHKYFQYFDTLILFSLDTHCYWANWSGPLRDWQPNLCSKNVAFHKLWENAKVNYMVSSLLVQQLLGQDFHQGIFGRKLIGSSQPYCLEKGNFIFIPRIINITILFSLVFFGLLCGWVLWSTINWGHQLYAKLWGNRRYTKNLNIWLIVMNL